MTKDILLVVIGYCIKYIYDKICERHPKVVYNVEQLRVFNIPPANPSQNQLSVWQHSLHLNNAGKTPATNIVITNEFMPFNINVSNHALGKTTVDRANKTITIASIAPKEAITISYLDYQSYPTVTYVVYHEGVAKHMPLLVIIKPKRWLTTSIAIFALIGLCVVFNFLWFKLPVLWVVAQGLSAKLMTLKS